MFYPVLGFAWSRQKHWLRAIGFEVETMSGVSNILAFGGAMFCGIMFQVYMRAHKPKWELLLYMLLLLVDSIARFNRSMKDVDEIPPGFFEWLIRPRKRYE